MAKITIGIVAGEVSGDALGGDFMAKMNAIAQNFEVTWVGVGGSSMAEQGLQSLFDLNRLSVMGLSEVVGHLPDLFAAKKQILSVFFEQGIDVFVGIDAPDFNLRLGKALKPKGVFCVQYVSPSIWAWRENRIHTIKQSSHLVLCLFGFETAVYTKHHHPAVCVGHPLFKMPRPNTQKNPQQICLMAGSRHNEINAILPILLKSFALLHQKNPTLRAVLPLAKPEHKSKVLGIIAQEAAYLSPFLTILEPHKNLNHPSIAQLALQYSAIALIASGTATLEALMLHTPMVVVYRVNAITHAIAKRLIKTPYIALPNILYGGFLVPEFVQEAAQPRDIAHSAEQLLSSTAYSRHLSHFANALRHIGTTDPAQALISHLKTHKHQDLGWLDEHQKTP